MMEQWPKRSNHTATNFNKVQGLMIGIEGRFPSGNSTAIGPGSGYHFAVWREFRVSAFSLLSVYDTPVHAAKDPILLLSHDPAPVINMASLEEEQLTTDTTSPFREE